VSASAPAPAPATTADPAPDDAEAKARRFVEMHGGNTTAALAKALEDNNRIAALVKENEALKAGKAPADTTAGAAPAAPKPPTEEEIQQSLREQAAADPECRRMADDFKTHQQAAIEIATYDQRGNLTGGKLFDVEQQLDAIEKHLDPAKFKLGVEPPNELVKEDLQRQRAELRGERRELRDQYRDHVSTAGQLRDGFAARVDGWRDGIIQKHTEATQAQESQDQQNAAEKAFNTTWDAEYAALVKEKGLSREDAADLQELLFKAADVVLNNGGDIEPHQLKGWLQTEADKVLKFRDRARGSAAVADSRRASAAVAQPAPSGPAAVAAAPAPGAPDNRSARQRRIDADRRTAVASKSIYAR